MLPLLLLLSCIPKSPPPAANDAVANDAVANDAVTLTASARTSGTCTKKREHRNAFYRGDPSTGIQPVTGMWMSAETRETFRPLDEGGIEHRETVSGMDVRPMGSSLSPELQERLSAVMERLQGIEIVRLLDDRGHFVEYREVDALKTRLDALSRAAAEDLDRLLEQGIEDDDARVLVERFRKVLPALFSPEWFLSGDEAGERLNRDALSDIWTSRPLELNRTYEESFPYAASPYDNIVVSGVRRYSVEGPEPCTADGQGTGCLVLRQKAEGNPQEFVVAFNRIAEEDGVSPAKDAVIWTAKSEVVDAATLEVRQSSYDSRLITIRDGEEWHSVSQMDWTYSCE